MNNAMHQLDRKRNGNKGNHVRTLAMPKQVQCVCGRKFFVKHGTVGAECWSCGRRVCGGSLYPQATPAVPARVLDYASGPIVRGVPPRPGLLTPLLIGPEAQVAEMLATGPCFVNAMPTARLGRTVLGWTRVLLVGAVGLVGAGGAAYVVAIAIGAAAVAIAALATALVNLACGLMLLGLAAVILFAIGRER